MANILEDNELSATEKPSNPKDLIGSNKLPLHLWPNTATAMGCIAFLNGALKYGKCNWRAIGISANTYIAASQRHMKAWEEGEEIDEDGVPHLSSALACLAIIVDARAAGKMTDDRPLAGGYHELAEELTPIVKHLKELHADKNPHQYTIADNEAVRKNDEDTGSDQTPE